jgi:hypothetical protein
MAAMVFDQSEKPGLHRRSFLTLAAVPALAQTQRDWANNQPVRYPDPDVIAVDKTFEKYQVFNAVIYRHYVGTKWAEGPAWCTQGRYLVWSDIPNNRQLRLLEEDGHVTTFRNPSGYSNGNTFDFEGRQLSCEHSGRRVARYEHTGKVTTIADKFDGKPLNSPNDIVVHPDGSIWFTDPPYGILGNYEGSRISSNSSTLPLLSIPESFHPGAARGGQIRRSKGAKLDDRTQPHGLLGRYALIRLGKEALHPCFSMLPVAHHTGEKPVKSGAVVMFKEMAQLMGNYVVNGIHGSLNQAEI